MKKDFVKCAIMGRMMLPGDGKGRLMIEVMEDIMW